MDTSRWQQQPISTGHIRNLRLCRRTTLTTTHRSWRTPKNKCSELKISDKTKHCFAITPPWKDPLKIRSSWQWNQYSCSGFTQVYALTMIQKLFSSYRSIDEINLEDNAVKINRPGTGRCPNNTIIVGLSSYVSVSFRMKKRWCVHEGGI